VDSGSGNGARFTRRGDVAGGARAPRSAPGPRGSGTTISSCLSPGQRSLPGDETTLPIVGQVSRRVVARAAGIGFLAGGTTTFVGAISGSAVAVAVGGTIVALSIVTAGVGTLWGAVALALRPQVVKYDHSWLTNVLGGTSTPHLGRAARRPGTEMPIQSESDEDRERGDC
jgi:hypothetical protein